MTRWLPEAWRKRLAAWGLDQAWPVLVLAVAVLVALAFALGPSTLNPTSQTREIEDVELPSEALQGQLSVQDTDGDGLADSLEIYVYGTDPEDPDTGDDGIPDGYLAHFGYQPLQPGVAEKPIEDPPSDALPETYNGSWPDRYQLTLHEFYERTRPTGYELGQDDPWWTSEDVASPADWDVNEDGIPDVFFVVAGLDPFDTPLDRRAPGSLDTLTVRENWALGTDPSLEDTDRDGIPDAEERELSTDPLAFSTLGAGVADGWVTGLGEDPLDPQTLFSDPDADGLPTADEFRASRDALPNASIAEILDTGLDPYNWDTSGNQIPDGWLVAQGLDPLDPTVAERVTDRASAYGPVRHLDDGPGDQDPLEDLELTVRDEYAAARPESWDESRDGVWWGGTSPATNDTDEDGLPDAVEIRGWYVSITADKGPGADAVWTLVSSDPSRLDSDGDGLNDRQEYRGHTDCGEGPSRGFPPTHPGRSDTAFSGLTDREEVCGFRLGGIGYDLGAPDEDGLDPTSADSDGDLISDGPEARAWHQRATSVAEPYPFEDTPFASTLDMASRFSRHEGAGAGTVAERLAPDGDWDGDGLANLLDPDSSSGLTLDGGSVCGQGSDNPQTTFLLDGPQIDPELYRFTDLSSTNPRPATDPASPDTDGDGLPDAWELRNGRFLQEEKRWSLDPTFQASDGGVTPDGEANFDDDVVRYIAPPDATKRYEHNNLAECRSGTNPHEASTAGDGVSDGWKVFWGLNYPDLVSSSDPIVGELTDGERSRILDRAAQVNIGPGQPLDGTIPWWTDRLPAHYTRYIPLQGSGCENDEARIQEAAGDVELAAFERVPPDPSAAGVCVLTAEESRRLLLGVRGSFNATYAQIDGTGVNPYLDDADRDGVDDWFEALHSLLPNQGVGGPSSPLKADGDVDADGDGLTLREEFEEWLGAGSEQGGAGGPDPRIADSDHDGLSDTDEVLAGFDPKDPRTVERLGEEGSGDADGDGVDDLQEIKGWSHETPPPLFKTSPTTPDTDRDGLIDNFVERGPSREELERIGVAHLPQDGEIQYLGEGLYGSHATELDSSGEGVPDGWQAYYQERMGTPGPTTEEPGLLDSYTAGRPTWWDEGLHGVWWWGMPPVAHTCGDLDGDGLSDTNGEDPFPARADNTYRHGSFQTQDPQDARAYIAAAPSPSATHERAQAWGPQAGDPFPLREDLQDGCPESGADPMELLDVEIDPSPPVFGEPLDVTGTVQGPGGEPLEGVTVVVSALTPSIDRALGAAFTGPDGSFSLESQFAPDQSTVVPPDSILLGTSGDQVSWTSQVEDLSPGPKSGGIENKLVVWTYNTTDAGWVTEEFPTEFHSTTRLEIQVPQDSRVGEPVETNVSLRDGLGRPIPEETVDLRWEGPNLDTERSGVTDTEGTATFQLPAPTDAGDTQLTASFKGAPSLQSSNAVRSLDVLRDARMTATTDKDALTAGETVAVNGTLTAEESPIPDASLQIVAGNETLGTATDDNGEFQTQVQIPSTATAGPFSLLVRFPGSEDIAETEAEVNVEVLGATQIQAPSNLTVSQASASLLKGQVTDAGGRPVQTTVSLEVPNLPAARAASDTEGRWALSLPQDLPRGTFQGHLVADETARFADAREPITVTVRGPSHLTLDPLPGTVAAGTSLTVTGQLVDGDGSPVADEALIAHLFGQPLQTVTDGNGSYRFEPELSADAPLGPTNLRVEYTGSIDGTLTNASVERTVHVKEFTELTLTTEHTPLARPSIAGTLTRQGGDPAPGQPVTATLTVPGQGEHKETATTGATGSVNLSFPADLADEAVRADITLRFPGTDTLSPSRVEDVVNLTTPLRWEATLPEKLPVETPVTVDGVVRDAAGPRIEEGTVRASADDTVIGTAPVRDGHFRLPLAVPASVPPGETRVAVTLDPPGLHASTPLEGIVLVTTQAEIQVDIGEALTPGEPYRVTATVTGQGQHPLANTTVIYWLSGPGGETRPSVTRTNETGHASLEGRVPDTLATDGATELTVVARGPHLTQEAAVAAETQVAATETLSVLPAILVAVLAVLIGVAAWLVRRRRRQLSEVQQIVEELLKELEAGNEYEASVLFAYERLTDHLERYGFLDRPEHTAREYFGAVQDAMPLPEDDVQAFVELFEQARYSGDRVGPRERTAAIALLRRLTDAIEQVGGQRGTSA